MPNIPTIPGSARIQTIPIGVKQDAGPTEQRLSAVRGAFQAAGGAVADAAGAVADYEQKKQKAEEVAAFNQASILTRKTTSAFRDSLRNNPNDQQWLENWQQTSNATRQQILADPRVKGPVRVKMMQTLDEWQGTTSAEFQTAADVAGSERRKRIGLLAADEALKDGNEKAATAAIDGLVRTGDMWKEDAEAKKKTFTATIQENQIRTGMASNPVQTLKDIDGGKFGGIPKGPLTTLRRETQAQIARQQNAGRDDILKRMDDGEVVNEDELKAKEQTGDISPEGAKSIRARVTQNNLKTAEQDQKNQMSEVQDYDLTAEKDPDQWAKEQKDRAAALPPALRVPLVTRIDNKLKSAKSSVAAQARPVETQIFDQMREDREKNFTTIPATVKITPASGGFLGIGKHGESVEFNHYQGGLEQLRNLTDDEVKEQFGEGMTKDKVVKAEQEHYANQQAKMREWFHSNPQATYEQANEHLQGLERPYVSAAVSSMLAKHVPVAVASEADLDALPAGARFIFNGRVGTKN